MPTADFITTAELSAFTKRAIPSGDADAATAIKTACAVVANYVERAITENAEVVRVNGTGRSSLPLPEWPITAVRSVVENGGTVAASAYGISPQGSLIRLDGSVWRAGLMNVTVDYTHGWPANAVPADLKTVALRVARRVLLSIGDDIGGKRSETIGEYSYTLADGVNGSDDLLTNPERLILDRYKRP